MQDWSKQKDETNTPLEDSEACRADHADWRLLVGDPHRCLWVVRCGNFVHALCVFCGGIALFTLALAEIHQPLVLFLWSLCHHRERLVLGDDLESVLDVCRSTHTQKKDNTVKEMPPQRARG